MNKISFGTTVESSSITSSKNCFKKIEEKHPTLLNGIKDAIDILRADGDKYRHCNIGVIPPFNLGAIKSEDIFLMVDSSKDIKMRDYIKGEYTKRYFLINGRVNVDVLHNPMPINLSKVNSVDCILNKIIKMVNPNIDTSNLKSTSQNTTSKDIVDLLG